MRPDEVRAERVDDDAAPKSPREDADAPDDEDATVTEFPETDQADQQRAPRPLDTLVGRAELLTRIRTSRTLPKGLRDRLCEFVQTLQLSGDADGVPAVPVAEAVEMIEAAIPQHLRLADEHLESPAHPRGENFFTGAADALSDDDAARIAAEQLAATGFGNAECGVRSAECGMMGTEC